MKKFCISVVVPKSKFGDHWPSCGGGETNLSEIAVRNTVTPILFPF
jgi:hypothetical protein